MSTLQKEFLNEIHLMTPFLESASLSSNIGMPQPAPQREDLLRKVRNMDQINIKTPNPKCRLYWCLIEFIDWS